MNPEITTVNSNHKASLALFFMFIAGLVFSAIFSLGFSAPAQADGPSCPPLTVCGGGGGTVDPPTDGGDDGEGNNDPTYEYSGGTNPRNVSYFSLRCGDWSGSGSWRLNSNCNNTNGQVISGNPHSPQQSTGNQVSSTGIPFLASSSLMGPRYGEGVLPVAYGLNNRGNSCGPQGEISGYQQNWSVRTTDQIIRVLIRNSDGGTSYGRSLNVGTEVTYSFLGCDYPTPEYSYQRCYWNFGGNISYSPNRNAAISSWDVFYNRPAQAGDPKTPTGGGNSAPSGRCTNGTSVNVFVNVVAPVDRLGYYSTLYSFNHRLYTNLKYVGGGVVYHDAGWTVGGNTYQSGRNYFTYSCRPGQANAIQGAYGSQSSIPNVDRYLNPATCPQVTWQCALDTPTTIGLDRTAVTSGRVSPTAAAKVMRNGEQVNVDFARVRVIDTSTSRDIDVTNGGTAPSIRNVSNIAYKTNVKKGSTPFYGDDPNASSQYFKMYTTRGKDTLEKFDTWKANNNSNLNKALSFNWASESSSERFAAQRVYRVTGEFYIPGGSTVGSGGAGASPGYQWKTGTYDCRDYSGRGSSRVDNGVLTSTSNPVEVIRSVNR